MLRDAKQSITKQHKKQKKFTRQVILWGPKFYERTQMLLTTKAHFHVLLSSELCQNAINTSSLLTCNEHLLLHTKSCLEHGSELKQRETCLEVHSKFYCHCIPTIPSCVFWLSKRGGKRYRLRNSEKRKMSNLQSLPVIFL